MPKPDWHPSPCPLPARRGEAGRRPGEGPVHGKPPFVFRMHWDHEPDRHPSPCPLRARRGEGGRRPGEGWFMGSINCTTSYLVTVLRNPLLDSRPSRAKLSPCQRWRFSFITVEFIFQNSRCGSTRTSHRTAWNASSSVTPTATTSASIAKSF